MPNYSAYSELPSISGGRLRDLRRTTPHWQEADVSAVIVTSHTSIQILVAVWDVQLAVSGVANLIKRLACQTASGTRDKVADLLSWCSFIAIINLSLTGVINSRGTTMKLSRWHWTFRDKVMVVQMVKRYPVTESRFTCSMLLSHCYIACSIATSSVFSYSSLLKYLKERNLLVYL